MICVLLFSEIKFAAFVILLASMKTLTLTNSYLEKPLFLCDQGCNLLTEYLQHKTTRVFFSVLMGASVGLAVASFAILSFPPPILMIGGGLIGAGLHLISDWAFTKEDLVYEELDQVAIAYSSSIQMVQAIDVVKRFVTPYKIQLEQSYDYHNFHHALTVVTEQVKTRNDLKSIWDTFLDRIEGREIYEPDGIPIVLHTQMEKERLAHRQIDVITERLNINSASFDRDCIQLNGIQQECFAGNTRYSIQELRRYIQTTGVQVYLARRPDNQQILGYVIMQEETGLQNRPLLYVTNVARKPEACSLGVGHKIFQHIFSQPMQRFTSLILEVRQSNADAIALYERWGFRQVGTRNCYYTYPLENAHVMMRSANFT